MLLISFKEIKFEPSEEQMAEFLAAIEYDANQDKSSVVTDKSVRYFKVYCNPSQYVKMIFHFTMKRGSITLKTQPNQPDIVSITFSNFSISLSTRLDSFKVSLFGCQLNVKAARKP